MSNTVDDLIESLKSRTFLPISQNTWNDSKLLVVMTEELRSYVVPQIMNVREDFFLEYLDTALESGRDLYPLVERAIGNSFKALSFREDNDDERQLRRTDVNSAFRFSSSSHEPSHFYMLGDSIRVFPKPSQSRGTIRQYFFRAQSELVKEADCGKITNISTGATETVFTINKDISGEISVGDKVDFQGANSPRLLHAYDITVSAITAATVTVANADIEDGAGQIRIAVGDYVTPRFKTCVPQIPVEYDTLLVQKVALKVYESLNDMKKYQLAFSDLQRMEKDLFGLIKSRIETQPRKVKNNKIMDMIGRF